MSRAKINDNGIIREMTVEEEKAFEEIERLEAEKRPTSEPTPEERIQALEAQNEALIDKLRAALILLGLEE